MASSKFILNSAKRVKAAASYDESEILAAMTSFDEVGQLQWNRLSKQFWDRLQNVDTRKYEKTPDKKRQTVTDDQKLVAIIRKIEYALTHYEGSDRTDVWDMGGFDLTLNEGYDEMDETAIINLHGRLISAGLSVEKAKPVIYVERGRLYNYLKFSEHWSGRWEELCTTFDVCSKTANCYIDFSKIVTAYPRLIICDLLFETIMYMYIKLQEYLTVQVDLVSRLAMSLRTTRLSTVNKLFSFNCWDEE